MAVLRKLGGVVLGSLVAVAVAGVVVKLLDRRNAPATAIDSEQTSAEPEVADPTASGSNPHPSCCVPRDQINPLQLDALERQLAARWPELRTLGRERVSTGDRVAFVLEAGRAAATRGRELLTGTAIAEHEGMLIVGLGCEPRLGRLHGLCCESFTVVPRAACIGWSKADTPERPAELGTSVPLTLARFVRSGEPIELVVHTVPGMRWTTEPADAARVDVLELGDGLATVAVRDAQPGRLDVVATAEHESWGKLSLGRWPIVVVT